MHTLYRQAALCLLLLSAPSNAALLSRDESDAARLLPPPPAADSQQTQDELAELKTIRARSTPDAIAAAARDSKDESPDIFNGAIGFDIAATPATFKLLAMVVQEEDADTKPAKIFFHRYRPYAVDSTIKTCAPVKPGKAAMASSYPSGHATLAFSMAEVLVTMMPEHSQTILKRASEYAENRLVCGVHYRSDIVAGQQFGTWIALKLMEKPAFQQQMQAALAELKGR